jgi:hypothetical protein
MSVSCNTRPPADCQVYLGLNSNRGYPLISIGAKGIFFLGFLAINNLSVYHTGIELSTNK